MFSPKLAEFLEEKSRLYNREAFIREDPVSIPHLFTRKEDIEISGFLAATIAWGQRPVIIRNAAMLMEWMDYSPFQFITGFSENDLKIFNSFYHRTFNGSDCIFFLESLQNIYLKKGGLENAFTTDYQDERVRHGIIAFRRTFLESPHEKRSEKHISSPQSNSSCKRLNLFLRWMVRHDNNGVDFGIWNNFSPAELICPLDVHTGNVSRKLGLLHRKQNDWKAAMELTLVLRKFDSSDPVRFDYALFGPGLYENFI